MKVRRTPLTFWAVTGLSFLIATNGFDIAARAIVGHEPLASATGQSLYYAAIQPVGTLLLLAPFTAIGWLSIRVDRSINGVVAAAFFLGFIAVLGWLYFRGYWAAQHALLQERWTAAALSVGLLGFRSIPIVLGAALLAGILTWRWGRRET
jgi:hypothetical protein